MNKLSRYKAKYTLGDLVKFVQDFHSQYGRPPKTKELKSLSKQGKSPSPNVFVCHGGLNWVIEKAGLKPQHMRTERHMGKALVIYEVGFSDRRSNVMENRY